MRGCRWNVCACACVCWVSVRAHQPCVHGCGTCARARAGVHACTVRVDCVSECARNQPALAPRTPCVSTHSAPSGPSERAGDVPARARPLRTGPPQTNRQTNKRTNKQINKQTNTPKKQTLQRNKQTNERTNKQTNPSERVSGRTARARAAQRIRSVSGPRLRAQGTAAYEL
jgi:hypothetical protein